MSLCTEESFERFRSLTSDQKDQFFAQTRAVVRLKIFDGKKSLHYNFRANCNNYISWSRFAMMARFHAGVNNSVATYPERAHYNSLKPQELDDFTKILRILLDNHPKSEKTFEDFL